MENKNTTIWTWIIIAVVVIGAAVFYLGNNSFGNSSNSSGTATSGGTSTQGIAVGEPNTNGSGTPSDGTGTPSGGITRPSGGQMETVPMTRAKDAVRAASGAQDATAIYVGSKEWSDSCLGLGKANESCAAVVTPGFEYRIVSGGKVYDMRTNADGSVVREDGQPTPAPSDATTTGTGVQNY